MVASYMLDRKVHVKNAHENPPSDPAFGQGAAMDQLMGDGDSDSAGAEHDREDPPQAYHRMSLGVIPGSSKIENQQDLDRQMRIENPTVESIRASRLDRGFLGAIFCAMIRAVISGTHPSIECWDCDKHTGYGEPSPRSSES